MSATKVTHDVAVAANDSAAPVLGADRLVSLDVLRGVAIGGILLMNIYAFAMPMAAYSDPLLMGGTDVLNVGTWFVTHIFVEQKFFNIFGMLFGAGIVLLTTRAAGSGVSYSRLFLRRQFWLLVLGALHAYLLWFGDILFSYAIIGVLAYLLRNKSPRTLITIAACLAVVTMLINTTAMIGLKQLQTIAAEVAASVERGEAVTAEQQAALEQWQEQQAMMASTPELVQQEVAAYLGRYPDIVKFRAPTVVLMQTTVLLTFSLWRSGLAMLLGMALFKLGILSLERSTACYRRLLIVGYGLGLPLTVFSAIDIYQHDFATLYQLGVGGISNFIGGILVGLGHLALVLLLVKSQVLPGLMQRFAAVGRMALTNYLLHSVILTTVFYGYGLALFGSLSRSQQLALALAVMLLQLFLSPWWLARYRFGPAEWLWRSLTYWKWQRLAR